MRPPTPHCAHDTRDTPPPARDRGRPLLAAHVADAAQASGWMGQVSGHGKSHWRDERVSGSRRALTSLRDDPISVVWPRISRAR
eukprot:4723139-Prymnesium_polylepis.4